jgi:hypothetical protein
MQGLLSQIHGSPVGWRTENATDFTHRSASQSVRSVAFMFRAQWSVTNQKQTSAKGAEASVDRAGMGNNISAASLLAGSIALQSASSETGLAVLKKSNDLAKQEGSALIQMMEESLFQADAGRLDVYA